MLAQSRCYELRKRDGPTGLKGLGRVEKERSVDPLKSPLDTEGPHVNVDVAPSKAQRFTLAESQRQSHGVEGFQPVSLSTCSDTLSPPGTSWTAATLFLLENILGNSTLEMIRRYVDMVAIEQVVKAKRLTTMDRLLMGNGEPSKTSREMVDLRYRPDLGGDVGLPRRRRTRASRKGR